MSSSSLSFRFAVPSLGSRPAPKNRPLSLPRLRHRLGLQGRRRSARSLCSRHRSLGLRPESPRPNAFESLGCAAVFLALGFGFGFASVALSLPPVALASDSHTSTSVHQEESQTPDGAGDEEQERGRKVVAKEEEDKELEEAFERWKSKSYALTVPLRVVALRGSVPPPWVKEFMQSQGKRARLQLKLRESLDAIFSDVSTAFAKGNVKPTSTAAADVVTIGDSWLDLAIKTGLIEPIEGAEDQDWFSGLNEKMEGASEWGHLITRSMLSVCSDVCCSQPDRQFGLLWRRSQVHLCRNCGGATDAGGKVWAAPYRWGSMVIAYKKSKFKRLNMAPIEDWKDLWRPELAGRISMVDSPREVIGTVLKYMGASYNTNDIDSKVVGGKNAVRQNLASLVKQVRLFDSTHYLKAFGVEDVWVAVGWSSDVLPVAKKMRNVAVIVPKSGASLWADLWAVPAASKIGTNQIGGRIRGPSPLIHQWIEFCLQSGRALPFQQGVLPGAVPLAINSPVIETPKEFANVNRPKLDTNLVAGVPPPHILNRCEFLEPLPEAMVSDYEWLIRSMQTSGPGFIERLQHKMSMVIRVLQLKLHAKISRNNAES
ncbi:uncharacterized protein LOC115728990 isoform X2 [Rhodamnia argentea]|uniref:Uncharacterized protein LOC115728990 isoform X2 n=1 Tax=Rhodamnia argentea TaxID=178133 RepID=A0ABM3H567_9MYRT|nr:uncharacterized protein LOC115728990 isoform X2 [Rhodamnia argentea]